VAADAHVSSADGLSDFVVGLKTMSLRNDKVGIGTARDQRAYTQYNPVTPIDRVTVENVFRSSWLGQRIISTLPDDMIRKWRRPSWDDLGDDDKDVKAMQRLEKKLQVKKRLLTASKWARLYGGALLIPVLRSQPDEVLSEPLDYAQIEKDDLVAIHVFDRWRASHDGTTINDALNPQNGMPEHYRLAESSVRLHHTRVIRLDGREMPYFIWRANSMWNDSVLQILINNLKQYDTAVAALTTMMFQLNVDVILQQGLRSLLSQKGGEAKAIERFRQFAISKAFNGVALLDKDTEEFQRHPYTFSGVDKAFDKVMYDVCGAADVPFTRLFGQSPAGMNATGESDTRNYYDHVAARREEHIDPALTQLDEFIVRSAFGHMPDGYESEWLPLWQETAKEEADAELVRAQTAQIYWNMGAIDEGIIAHDIYSRSVFNGMTRKHVKVAEMSAREQPEATETTPPPAPGQKIAATSKAAAPAAEPEDLEDDEKA
jgi:phage-related protein (TIGR01555 family)